MNALLVTTPTTCCIIIMQPTNNKYLMPKQILKAHKIRLYPTDEQQ
ncbi:helix-turn-helix domain-containing protein, partial [Psychrobacter faecalis]